MELEIAGDGATANRLALIQEVQHHPVRGDVLHVDFHAVAADEKLHASVPVETVGEPAGVKNFGGMLEVPMHALEVECLPKDLPEVIRVDVSAPRTWAKRSTCATSACRKASRRMVDGDLTVVRVAAPTVAEEARLPTRRSGDQPEVIKEKKAEEKEAK